VRARPLCARDLFYLPPALVGRSAATPSGNHVIAEIIWPVYNSSGRGSGRRTRRAGGAQGGGEIKRRRRMPRRWREGLSRAAAARGGGACVVVGGGGATYTNFGARPYTTGRNRLASHSFGGGIPVNKDLSLFRS